MPVSTLTLRLMLFLMAPGIGACASTGRTHRPTEALAAQGPAALHPSRMTRVTVARGVSVLAPPDPECHDSPQPRQDVTFDRLCTWKEADGGMYVGVRLTPLPVSEASSDKERLAVARVELTPEDDPLLEPDASLTWGRYPGFSQLTRWEGMAVKRQVFVVGRRAVVLLAAVPEGASFAPYALFFESLSLEQPFTPTAPEEEAQ